MSNPPQPGYGPGPEQPPQQPTTSPPWPPPPPPIAPPAPPAKPPRRGLRIFALVFAGFAVLCLIGTITAIALSGGDEPDTTPNTAADATATQTRQPAPSAQATTAAAPALPRDVVYQGRGDKIVKLSLPDKHLHTGAFTHSGSGNFAVWTVDDAGQDIDLLVNDIGKYSGIRPVDFVQPTPAALKIEASGSWKVTIRVLERAPVWPTKTSGRGAAVLQVAADAGGGLSPVKVTHGGSSNFAVWVYTDEERELLVNEIGKYSGEVLIPEGAVAIDIEADGAWTMTRA